MGSTDQSTSVTNQQPDTMTSHTCLLVCDIISATSLSKSWGKHCWRIKFYQCKLARCIRQSCVFVKVISRFKLVFPAALSYISRSPWFLWCGILKFKYVICLFWVFESMGAQINIRHVTHVNLSATWTLSPSCSKSLFHRHFTVWVKLLSNTHWNLNVFVTTHQNIKFG